MKAILVATLCMMIGGSLQAQKDLHDIEIKAEPPQQVYVPQGFDSNDNSQIVVEGAYNNSCYRWASPALKIDQRNQRIYIKNKAYFYPKSVCLQMRISYVKEVDFGVLSPGQYTIYFVDNNNKPHPFTKLQVEEALTSQPDDYLYLPVDRVEYLGQKKGIHYIQVEGQMASRCMKFKKAKVTHRRQNHVVEVLPIAEKLQEKPCPKRLHPYRQVIPLGKLDLPLDNSGHPEKLLIHVRSLNGLSVNEVVHPEQK